MKNTEIYTVLIILLLAFSGFFSNFNGDITGNAFIDPATTFSRLVFNSPYNTNFNPCPSGYIGAGTLKNPTYSSKDPQGSSYTSITTTYGVNMCIKGDFIKTTYYSQNCPSGYSLAGIITQGQSPNYKTVQICTKSAGLPELRILDVGDIYGQIDPAKTCPIGYDTAGIVFNSQFISQPIQNYQAWKKFCVLKTTTTTPTPGTCSDNIKNQDETDVDCGGKICKQCGGGKTCYITADCTSGTCYGGVCGSPGGTCNDSLRNQDETDVDCGGLLCNACIIGKTCSLNRDCRPGSVCTTTTAPLTVSTPWGSVTQNITSSTCTATTGGSCIDGIKNGAETDVDCGGNVCAACNIGRTCSVNSDCVSGASCFNGVCSTTTAPSPQIVACASTPTQNATLGDLNGDGIVNLVDANLLARVFYPQFGNYAPSCFNKIKDTNEQDIDCGIVCGNICPSLTTQVPSTFCISLFGTTICGPATTATSPPMYCCQDLNNDGVVNTTDVNKIIEIASGIKPSAGRCSAVNQNYAASVPVYPALACGNTQRVGDLNNDSTINLVDYYLINTIRKGLISTTNQNCCNDWNNDGTKDYIADLNLNGFIEVGDENSAIPYALSYSPAPSNFCSTQTAVVAPSATCSDGIKNQNEADVDCGGSCVACTYSKTCNTNSDCATGLVCDSGVCRYGSGQSCTTSAQCASGLSCINNICTTTTTPAPSPAPSGGGGAGGGGSANRGAGAGAFVCSNGRLDLGEECDDANIFSDDGCNKDCKIEYCGDGVIQYGLKEQCDPADGITCALGCTIISQVPKPVIPNVYTEPVYVPEYPEYVEPTQPSRLPKIVGTIVTITALVSIVSYLLRKRSKSKSQQQPFSLPVRYSRGSR